MKKVIISDTSPLIALAKLDCLDLLLSVFSEIHVPQAVYIEATYDKRREDARKNLLFVKAEIMSENN